MDYSFIPLKNWHKLVNIFLLIEQCSLVLHLGELGQEIENTLFGINLILILVMQEKDEVHGQIKYSMIPLCINNAYLLLTNFKSLRSSSPPLNAPNPSSPSSSHFNNSPGQRIVNKQKVFYGIIWYIGSLVGYCFMENMN